MTQRFPLLLLSSGLVCFAFAATASAQSAVPVRTAPVQEMTVAAGKSFVATVHPTRHAILGSAVDGRVVEFNYDEGDRVEEGAAVAQLLTESITLVWEAAKAELEARQAELLELENGTRPEEIEQAKARMLAAEARMQYLDLRRNRAIELYENRKVTSAETRDEAVSAADASTQAYLEAKSIYELAVVGPRVEQIAQAKARVAMQTAIVQELADRIKKHTIRARFPGFIVKKSTEVGAWASQGGAVAELAHLDSVDVIANVPEQNIPYVQVGKEVSVEIYAIRDERFIGTVFSINPQADLRSRTFPVKIRVKNEFRNDIPLLKAGMMGSVVLQTGDQKTALMVPKDAVVLGGGTPLVYVVQEQSGKYIAQPVPVRLGVAEKSLIEVTGELTPQMHVVTHGNERLRPGQEVTVLANAQAQNSGG